MAKITPRDSANEKSVNFSVEAAIEEFVKAAESQSAQVLENIVLVASALIDNKETIDLSSLAQVRQQLAQLDKNVSASMDVMRGMNLFLETLEKSSD